MCPVCPRAASTTPRATTASAARPASCAADLRTLRPPASAALALWLCLPTSKLRHSPSRAPAIDRWAKVLKDPEWNTTTPTWLGVSTALCGGRGIRGRPMKWGRPPPPPPPLTWCSPGACWGITTTSVSAASPRAASCEVAAPSVSADPAMLGPPASGELGRRVPDWGGVCVRGPGDAALPASISHDPAPPGAHPASLGTPWCWAARASPATAAATATLTCSSATATP